MQCDVAILGGGLAGLTLALQLRDRFPDLDVRVLERSRHPLPVAAHKVGESTVEIGARYFAETLGLREHLAREHLFKFGFRFFWSDGREDLEDLCELGVSKVLPFPTYQIDRGIFENHLGEQARARGATFLDGATVRDFSVAGDGGLHHVVYDLDGARHELSARWLIDAAGRSGLLKRRLGLAQDNDHGANAVWFRLDDRLAIDDWRDDAEWGARCTPPERWRSTNHLVGPGYWVWLIPLSSGAHSVGIVCDAQMHPLQTMNSFDKALDWLQRHQPAVAREVAARRDRLLDFRFLRDFSYGCTRVFSGDRWALAGESGVFLDPFYSPGSDFIAIGNTYITELIAHDRAGQPLAPFARLYEQLFLSFYRNTLSLYQDQYPLFGDARVMPVKVIWDYTFYWGVLCVLAFQDRMADIALLGEFAAPLQRAAELNLAMQALFRDWHARSDGANPAQMLDQGALPWFRTLNSRLTESLDDAGVRRRLRGNLDLLDRLAAVIRAMADEVSNTTSPALPDLQLDVGEDADPPSP